MNAISVVKKGDRFVAKFKFDYATKDIVKAAGFRFNGVEKEWWTDDPMVAARIVPQTSADMRLTVNTSVSAPINGTAIAMHNGLELLPFQKEGVAWLKGRPTALLADAMGLGKTIQAIGLINVTPDISRILIVCPASLKLNWENELNKWCIHPFVYQVIMPGSAWVQEANVTIINYEQVGKFRRDIDRVGWDLLICDESHYLKNGKSQRTQNVVGKWDANPSLRVFPIKAKQRIFMTGTPILNRPKELWTTVRALDVTGLGNDWLHFHTRYCGAYKDVHGWQLDGASNLEELNQRLRSGIMLRRRKEDVLPELPPKRRQIILLEPVTNAAKLALKNEKALIETAEKMEALRAEVEALSVNKADDAYKKAVQKLEACEGVAFSETAKLRHETALAKVFTAMECLINVLESEEKIVVFAHHHDVIDLLVKGLAEQGVVTFDGRVADVRKRQLAVDAFQTDPKVRVIVGSIGAMGSGWTLTAASYVAFVELDWVPGNLNQAEDRLHRIGQKQSILVQHLMLNGSFDAHMAKVVMAKQKVIERATG